MGFNYNTLITELQIEVPDNNLDASQVFKIIQQISQKIATKMQITFFLNGDILELPFCRECLTLLSKKNQYTTWDIVLDMSNPSEEVVKCITPELTRGIYTQLYPMDRYREYFLSAPELQLFRTRVEYTLIIPSQCNIVRRITAGITSFFKCFHIESEADLNQLFEEIVNHTNTGLFIDFGGNHTTAIILNILERIYDIANMNYHNMIVSGRRFHFRKCIYKQIFDTLFIRANVFPYCNAGNTRCFVSAKGRLTPCKYAKRCILNETKNLTDIFIPHKEDKSSILKLLKNALCVEKEFQFDLTRFLKQ